MQQKNRDETEDVIMAKQALQFLKQNRVSRIDSSRHLNLMLNPDAFNAVCIGENAKIMLKFVRLTERLNNQADRFRMQLQ